MRDSRLRPLAVVGDSLLDRDLEGRVNRLCPDAPVPVVDQPAARSRPGGAALAATLAAGDGRPVTLITGLGDDDAGAELRTLLERAGVTVVDLGLAGRTPEKVRVRAHGRSLLRLDYGEESSAVGSFNPAAEDVIERAGAVLVADYGRGVAAAGDVRAAVAARPARVPLVWDPHPKGPEPVPGATLVTPNRSEAARFSGLDDDGSLAAAVRHARTLGERWRTSVAVTVGAAGAVLVHGDTPLAVPAPPVAHGDPCGAGDRFASTAAGMLADGALPSEAVVAGVIAASAFVAAGGAASVRLHGEPAPGASPAGATATAIEAFDGIELAARVRAAGGTVVATGGCFDLLHAGHASTLEAARSLGDCLIVCLNSDASVRRLKGEGRPVVPEADRARLLRALGCVDAVVVFDDDTPEAVLERLHPHVFVKGGDYRVGDLPEAGVLARWGGQAVVVPYLEGRSSTRIMEEAARRGVS